MIHRCVNMAQLKPRLRFTAQPKPRQAFKCTGPQLASIPCKSTTCCWVFYSFSGGITDHCRNAKFGFWRMMDLSLQMIRALKRYIKYNHLTNTSSLPSLQWLTHIWEGSCRCEFTYWEVDKLNFLGIRAGNPDHPKVGVGQCCTFQALDHFCSVRILDWI